MKRERERVFIFAGACIVTWPAALAAHTCPFGWWFYQHAPSSDCLEMIVGAAGEGAEAGAGADEEEVSGLGHTWSCTSRGQ